MLLILHIHIATSKWPFNILQRTTRRLAMDRSNIGLYQFTSGPLLHICGEQIYFQCVNNYISYPVHWPIDIYLKHRATSFVHDQRQTQTHRTKDNSCQWWQINFNTLRPRQNGRHFADDIFYCIFMKENVWIPITISWKFVPKGPINNIPTLVQIMAWRRLGDKPLSESMMISLPTHICVTRPQWVNMFR